MFDKKEILKNLDKSEEKILFSKAIDQIMICLKNHEKTFTCFIDPYKISIFLQLIGKNNQINTKTFGGHKICERMIIGFSPEYMDINYEDFPITPIEIEYNIQFSKNLTHRDFLGSLMGLGIVRDKIGDIILNKEKGKAIVFVIDDIAEYICINLERVAKTKVNTRICNLKDLEVSGPEENLQRLIVSSLRVDNVLSTAFNLSRSKASGCISNEKVFINWNPVDSNSKQVAENDIITLRGIGRIKIKEIAGKTKKDKFLIDICRYT